MTGPTAGPACTWCGRDWLGHEHPCATAPDPARPCEWLADFDGLGNQIGKAWCPIHEHEETVPPPLRRDDALRVVCEVAFQWAGEYGYAMPERATEVWDAAKLLRPDLEPTDDD